MIAAETIVNFLCFNDSDHKFRRFVDYLSFTHQELEKNHDYIQWMFPLHEASKFNRDCPVLTPEIVNEAKGYASLQSRLESAVKRMESFYGIGDHFDIDTQKKHFKNGNHNMLRITRIIRSLRLLEQDDLAKQFYDNALLAAMLAKEEIDSVTRQYWIKAMHEEKWETMK
jgi:hypothetical protein